MKKSLCILISTLLIVVCLCGCRKNYIYDARWIVGKTSSQITEKYGKFDFVDHDSFSDDPEYSYAGKYVISYTRLTRYSRDEVPGVNFIILFDEHDIAQKCFEKEVGTEWWKKVFAW